MQWFKLQAERMAVFQDQRCQRISADSKFKLYNKKGIRCNVILYSPCKYSFDLYSKPIFPSRINLCKTTLLLINEQSYFVFSQFKYMAQLSEIVKIIDVLANQTWKKKSPVLCIKNGLTYHVLIPKLDGQKLRVISCENKFTTELYRYSLKSHLPCSITPFFWIIYVNLFDILTKNDFFIILWVNVIFIKLFCINKWLIRWQPIAKVLLICVH